MTCYTYAQPVYKYDGKWWVAEWFGIWFIREYELQDGPIYNTEELALKAAEDLISKILE